MVNNAPMGPVCQQLQNCYHELTAEACRTHNAHCESNYNMNMRDHNEAACEMALREEAREHKVMVVARVDSDTEVHPGEQMTVALRGDRLHFFDVETGEAIR